MRVNFISNLFNSNQIVDNPINIQNNQTQFERTSLIQGGSLSANYGSTSKTGLNPIKVGTLFPLPRQLHLEDVDKKELEEATSSNSRSYSSN